MSLIRIRGIVVKDFPLSEQDKVVYLLTRRRGIVKSVAKGALKIKSRFAQVMQFPCCVDALVYRKSTAQLATVSDANLRHAFAAIRSSVMRFAFASSMAELVLTGVDVGEHNESVYQLLLQYLFAFEHAQATDFESILSAFRLQFLQRTGYSPELGRCIECGQAREQFGRFYFSLKGGLICQRCQGAEAQAVGILPVTVAAMEHLRGRKPSSAIPGGVRRIERQIMTLLDAYVAYHLGQQSRGSRQLIDTLQQQA